MRLFMGCTLTLAAMSAVWGQASPTDIQKVIDEGKKRNQAAKTLNELSTKIGPRLTGSPDLAKGQDWAVAKFKSFGITKVQKEQWGEVPVGFQRGPRQSAKMVAPFEKEFVFTTPAWSPGTSGKAKGRAVKAPTTMDEFNAVKDQLKGAWVVMGQPISMRGPGSSSNDLHKAITEAGILGRVYGSNDERIHTWGRFTGLDYNNLPKDVQVIIRASDMKSIQRCFTAERPVELEFDIENRFIKGPVPQYNVVAEIPGTERPDEVVIVCGHFDSWNGPGSQGANDNGTGSSVAIEAARILMKSGVKPKRTIRFILWSGEEQGLLGSRAYVEKHKDELPKISAVFNDDGGSNYQGGYVCTEPMKKILDAAIAPVNAAFPNLPAENRAAANLPSGGSSDHAPFVWAGVPAFFTMEKGKQDYGFVWHTQNDRYEFAIEEYLTQSSTNAAAVAFYVAQEKDLLPRAPVPQRDNSPRPPVGGAYHYEDQFDHDHDHEGDYFYYVLDSFLRKWLPALRAIR
ncbi:MAG: hypothetical protein HONBIEJF_00653 [Fimbriimonadaceae bacterium]|nr:hypothetical protein [Fimbriimonadaceae bacterium]